MSAVSEGTSFCASRRKAALLRSFQSSPIERLGFLTAKLHSAPLVAKSHRSHRLI
jgi:hypothetical protein